MGAAERTKDMDGEDALVVSWLVLWAGQARARRCLVYLSLSSAEAGQRPVLVWQSGPRPDSGAHNYRPGHVDKEGITSGVERPATSEPGSARLSGSVHLLPPSLSR